MNRKIILSMVMTLGLLVQAAHASPTIYIPLGSSNKIIAVDGQTDRIIKTYNGLSNPHGLVATPDGEYLIAGSLNETQAAKDGSTSKLYLVHPVHGHVMSTINVNGWTHHQAITPNGRYVLSTHPTRGYISVADLQSNRIVKIIKTGMVPNYTVINRKGTRAYVSNTGSGNIVEIDLGTWKVKRSLDAGPAPEHIVLSADESKIFVANARAGKISVVSMTTGKVLNGFKVGQNVHGLDLGDDGKTVFASSKRDQILVAIDSDTGKQRSLGLEPSPYHLNVIKGTGKVYVSSSKKSIIWVVDQKSLKVVSEIQLPGGEGHQMAVVEQ